MKVYTVESDQFDFYLLEYICASLEEAVELCLKLSKEDDSYEIREFTLGTSRFGIVVWKCGHDGDRFKFGPVNESGHYLDEDES